MPDNQPADSSPLPVEERPHRPSINWTAIFVSYCNGVPLEQLAEIHDISLDAIKRKAVADNWKAGRLELPLVTNLDTPVAAVDAAGRNALDLLPADAKAHRLAVAANREKNLAVARQLQDDIAEKVAALREGRFKIKKAVKIKMSKDVERVEIVELDPTPAECLTLATYAKTVADLSYRALGDMGSGREKGETDLREQPPALTVILPAAIAKPRPRRISKTSVVEVEASTVTTTPSV